MKQSPLLTWIRSEPPGAEKERRATFLTAVAVLLAIGVTGCSDDLADDAVADASSDAVVDTNSSDALSDGEVGVDVAPVYEDFASLPVDVERSLEWDGEERSYWLYVPSAYDSAAPTPLVLNFHGATPAVAPANFLQKLVTEMNATAEEHGFIVVYPLGLPNADGTQTWNSGSCCSDDDTRDDLGLVESLLDALEHTINIDGRRIYATGHSNGGFMSHMLACQLADRIAAVAPVAAQNGTALCDPGRGVSVMAINGTADELVEYEAARENTLQWLSRNSCSTSPEVTFAEGDATCETWSECDDEAEVVFCTIAEGGHTWPGGSDIFTAFGFGATSTDLDANEAMWTFFQRHALD